MLEFFNNLAIEIENFMATPIATAIGAAFLIVFSALILYLIKYFEKN